LTVSKSEALFGVLRQSTDASYAAAMENLVRDTSDRELCRINVLDFARFMEYWLGNIKRLIPAKSF
jgi:hypothetical protein